jgi:hypothetical protein
MCVKKRQINTGKIREAAEVRVSMSGSASEGDEENFSSFCAHFDGGCCLRQAMGKKLIVAGRYGEPQVSRGNTRANGRTEWTR